VVVDFTGRGSRVKVRLKVSECRDAPVMVRSGSVLHSIDALRDQTNSPR